MAAGLGQKVRVLIKSVFDAKGIKQAQNRLKKFNKSANRMTKMLGQAKGMRNMKEDSMRLQSQLKEAGISTQQVGDSWKNAKSPGEKFNRFAQDLGITSDQLKSKMSSLKGITHRTGAAFSASKDNALGLESGTVRTSKALSKMENRFTTMTDSMGKVSFKNQAGDLMTYGQATEGVSKAQNKMSNSFNRLMPSLDKSIGRSKQLSKTTEAVKDKFNRALAPIDKNIGRRKQLSKTTDKQASRLRGMGHQLDKNIESTRQFAFENLSLMFAMMQVQKMTKKWLKPAAKAYNMSERWGTTLQMTMLPAMESIQPIFRTLNKFLRNMPDFMKMTIGLMIIFASQFSKIGMLVFQAKLAMNGFNIATAKANVNMGIGAKLLHGLTFGFISLGGAEDKETKSKLANIGAQKAQNQEESKNILVKKGLVGATYAAMSAVKSYTVAIFSAIAAKIKDTVVTNLQIAKNLGLMAVIGANLYILGTYASALWGVISAKMTDVAASMKGVLANILYGTSATGAAIATWQLAAAIAAATGGLSLIIPALFGITSHLDMLGGAVDTVIESLHWFMENLGMLMGPLWITYEAVKFLSKALAGSGLQEAFDIVSNSVQGLIDHLGWTQFMMELGGGVVNWFTGVWEDAEGTLSSVWAGLTSAASGLWDAIMPSGDDEEDGEGGGFIEGILPNFSDIKKKIKKFGKNLKKAFGKIWKNIKNLPILGTVATYIENLFNDPIGTLKATFRTFMSFFGQIWTQIKKLPILGQIAKTVETLFDNPIEAIRSIFNKFKSFFKSIWSTIESLPILGTVASTIKTLFDDPVSAIESTISGIKQTFKDVFNAIKELPIIGEVIDWVSNLSFDIDWPEPPGFVMDLVDKAIEAGGWLGGQILDKIPGFDDFIWRPGQGIASINPNDTIMGMKEPGRVGGGGNTYKKVEFSPNVTVEATVSEEVDIDTLKDELSREWVDELEGMIR